MTQNTQPGQSNPSQKPDQHEQSDPKKEQQQGQAPAKPMDQPK